MNTLSLFPNVQLLDPLKARLKGINLVEASAGTGKTYNITAMYIRFITELDLEPGDILVVTYTEAATQELRDRILKRLRAALRALKDNQPDDDYLKRWISNIEKTGATIAKLEAAIRNFDDSAIYTIHGFCNRILQEFAFESGAMYELEFVSDDSEILQEVVDDFWRNFVAERSDDETHKILLKFVRDSGYGPDKLADLIKNYISKPYLIYQPQDTEIPDLDGKLQKLTEHYEYMRSEWKADKEHIGELLYADELNGNKYRKSSLPNWITEMDEFLTFEVPPIRLSDHFNKFTSKALEDAAKNGNPPTHPFFEHCEQYEKLSGNLQEYLTWFRKKVLQRIPVAFEMKKQQMEVMSFDDLLLNLRNALVDSPHAAALADKIREKYPVALVDEFQDTDPVQYEIFKSIYVDQSPENSALYMIGDPKQSIYSFRGADVFAYMRARDDADKEGIYNLRENYRSTQELIDGINYLFGQSNHPFLFDEIAFNEVKAGRDDYPEWIEPGGPSSPVQMQVFETGDKKLTKEDASTRVADYNARKIAHLIQGGKQSAIRMGKQPVRARDIAVLVRSHKQAEIMQQALLNLDIKSVQYSQQSVFDTPEAGEMQRLLRAIAEPGDEHYILAALSTSILGKKASDIAQLRENDEQWITVMEQFREWHNTWQHRGFMVMFRQLMQAENVQERLVALERGERRLTNILHLAERVQVEDRQRKGGLYGIIKWMAKKRDEDRQEGDEEQLRLESDEELVKIVTMHRSKGLQYPVVFCPFLWDGLTIKSSDEPVLYHDDDLQKVYLDLHNKKTPERLNHRKLMHREELAESLRLAYVAVTRAQYHCYISWIPIKSSEFSPLGYLLLGREQVLEALDAKVETRSNKKDQINIQDFDEGLEKLRLTGEEHNLEIISARETENPQTVNKIESNGKSLKPKTYEGRTNLKPRWRTTSFSSLAHSGSHSALATGYDEIFDDIFGDPETAKRRDHSIFGFPRGARAGTCVHYIFEEMDFASGVELRDQIEDGLKRYGFETDWQDVLYTMIQWAVSKSVIPGEPEFSLSQLTDDECLKELEFYYPTTAVDAGKMLQIIRDTDATQGPAWLKAEELSMELDAEKGLMKGFIDLTFRHNGKYYILDYKTNHLGDQPQKYQPDTLKEEIQNARYDLQYYIYTLALHRYLKHRMQNYTYDDHFGGVIYLFVRGLESKPESRNGVYFDRPDQSRMQRFDQYMTQGEIS